MIEGKYEAKKADENEGSYSDNVRLIGKTFDFKPDRETLETKTSNAVEIFFLYHDDNGSLKGFNSSFHDDIHIRWNIGHTDNYEERIRTLFHEWGHAGNPLRSERENRIYTHTDYW